MLETHDRNGGYTVRFGDAKIECADVEQVVEVVKAMKPFVEPTVQTYSVTPSVRIARTHNDIQSAAAALFRESPMWRQPIEILKALRKRGVPRAEATYHRVYAALRYGPFVKRDGRWNLSDAV